MTLEAWPMQTNSLGNTYLYLLHGMQLLLTFSQRLTPVVGPVGCSQNLVHHHHPMIQPQPKKSFWLRVGIRGQTSCRCGNGRTGAVRSDLLWVAGKAGQDFGLDAGSRWRGLRRLRTAAAGGTRHPEGGFSCPPLALIQEVGRIFFPLPHYSDLALPIEVHWSIARPFLFSIWN